MSHDLHDRFEDLVADAPTYVVPDARAAWAAGARRRTRHRFGVAAAVVGVLALVASAVTWLPRTVDPAPADPDGAGVEGYPSRVDEPWVERDLPDRPGPLAGVLQLENQSFRAVSRTGRTWVVPQDEFSVGGPIALSSDGIKLAYRADRKHFVLRDLASGSVEVVDSEGNVDGATKSEPKVHYWIYEEAPAFWSPHGDRVFVYGAFGGPGYAALLVGGDATAAVPAPEVRGEHMAWPAGWTPTGDLVWLAGEYDADSARWATVVVTTTTGEEVRRVDLKLPDGIRLAGQWAGSVSPDGQRLLVVNEGSGDSPLFSLVDGNLVDEVTAQFPDCPMSWAGDRPRPTDARQPEIMVEPTFAATCEFWASDALAGSAHRGLGGRVFGDSNEWLSWHWQEVALGALTVSTLAAALLVVLRKRRRRADHLG